MSYEKSLMEVKEIIDHEVLEKSRAAGSEEKMKEKVRTAQGMVPFLRPPGHTVNLIGVQYKLSTQAISIVCFCNAREVLP